jgi:hypothetical protein
MDILICADSNGAGAGYEDDVGMRSSSIRGVRCRFARSTSSHRAGNSQEKRKDESPDLKRLKSELSVGFAETTANSWDRLQGGWQGRQKLLEPLEACLCAADRSPATSSLTSALYTIKANRPGLDFRNPTHHRSPHPRPVTTKFLVTATSASREWALQFLLNMSCYCKKQKCA